MHRPGSARFVLDGLRHVEARRRQSRLDFFFAEAELFGCDSTLQAISYAMDVVEEMEMLEGK